MKIPSSDNDSSLASEDDYCSGSRNISHHTTVFLKTIYLDDHAKQITDTPGSNHSPMYIVYIVALLHNV